MEMVEKLVDGIDPNGIAGKFLVRAEQEIVVESTQVVETVAEVVKDVEETSAPTEVAHD